MESYRSAWVVAAISFKHSKGRSSSYQLLDFQEHQVLGTYSFNNLVVARCAGRIFRLRVDLPALSSNHLSS